MASIEIEGPNDGLKHIRQLLEHHHLSLVVSDRIAEQLVCIVLELGRILHFVRVPYRSCLHQLARAHARRTDAKLLRAGRQRQDSLAAAHSLLS